MFLRSNLYEHQQRMLLPISDFGSQTHTRQSMDQLLELSFGSRSICLYCQLVAVNLFTRIPTCGSESVADHIVDFHIRLEASIFDNLFSHGGNSLSQVNEGGIISGRDI